jgi:hypothetical protein
MNYMKNMKMLKFMMSQSFFNATFKSFDKGCQNDQSTLSHFMKKDMQRCISTVAKRVQTLEEFR